MKKIIAAFSFVIMLFSLAACAANDEENFAVLRDRVAEAGYEVSNAYVDASFKDVVTAFAVKVNFDANTVATIPVILTKSEKAAANNCAMFGEDSIKQPIQNGKVFSYPGKDYPEDVIALITAIVNGEDIPTNPNVE